MGYSRYVGRVGALAVVLGIGGAVATTPGFAFAQSESGGSAGSTGDPGTSTSQDNTPGSSTPPNTTVQSGTEAGPDPAGGGPANGDAGSPSDGTTTSVQNSGSGAASGTATDPPPAEIAAAIDASTNPSPSATPTASVPTPTAPASAPATPTGSAPTPVSATSKPADSNSALQQQQAALIADGGVVGDTHASLRTMSALDASGVSISTLSAPTTPNTLGSTSPSPSARFAAAALDSPPVTPTPPNPVAGFISGVLSFIGLGPAATVDPTAPTPPPPTVWALLAWVNRELTRTIFGQSTPPASQPSTGQAADNSIFGLINNILRALSNKAPKAAPTFGPPDPNGIVTGNLNATDANGDPLTYTIKTPPTNGTATVSSTGAFTYDPTDTAQHQASATAKNDVDTFVVTISDGRGGVTNVTVRNLPIAPTNDAPVNGRYAETQINPRTLAITGKVQADDPNHDALTYSGSTTTVNGRVVVKRDGTYTYTPSTSARNAAIAGQTVTDSFSVTANDGHGGTLGVPVSVTISSGNHAPTNGGVAGTQTNSVTGEVTGRVTATDADHDTLTYSGPTTSAKGGDVMVDSNGNFTYKPTTQLRADAASGGTAAQDAFTVLVSDGRGGTLNVPVNVTISVNRAPVNDTAGQPSSPDRATGLVTGSVHATDPDPGNTVTYESAGPSSLGGTVAVNSTTGAYTYTPTDAARAAALASSNPADADSFVIKAKDGRGGTVDITVNVVVAETNRAPVAVAAPTVASPDSAGVVTGKVNVIDANRTDTLTYTVISGPTYGTVQIDDATGAYSYKPTDQARLDATLSTDTVETDTFTVRVTDGLNAPVDVTIPNFVVAELPINTVIAEVPTGANPRAVVVSPNGAYSYVANTDDDTVTIIKTSDNSKVDVPVGDSPLALAMNSDGTKLYVATAGDQKVTELNATTGAVIRSFTLDGEPAGLTVSPDDAYVYTANTNSTISLIDLANNTVTPIHIDPIGLVTNSDGSLIYALNAFDGNVIVLQGGTGTYVDRIDVGNGAVGVAISPDDSTLFVTNSGDDNVQIINLADKTSRFVDVGDQPAGIQITSDGKKAYVANYGSNTVSVIDLTNNDAVTDVPVGQGPWAVAINPAGTQATITNRTDGKVTVLVLAGNEAPRTQYTLDPANTATGQIAGHFTTVDPDGDTVSYRTDAQPPSGYVAVNPDGTFTYTPNAAARDAAAATAGVDTAAFTVVVDDNHGATTNVVVTVQITPSVSAIAGQTSVVGYPVESDVRSTNGERVIRLIATSPDDAGSTITYHAVVIDTATGAQVGDTIDLPSLQGVNVRVDPNSTRAALLLSQYDPATGVNTHVIIVDTQDGSNLDSADLAGNLYGFGFSPDSSSIVASTVQYPNNSVPLATSTVTVINADDGTVIGTVADLPGQIGTGSLTFGADSTAYQTFSHSADPGDGSFNYVLTTQVVAIDTHTGLEVGRTVALDGGSAGGMEMVNGKGILTTYTRDATTYAGTTRVVLIDTSTMSVIGTSPDIAGTPMGNWSGGVIVSPDKTRAIQVTYPGSSANNTTVSIIDTSTGNILGTKTISGQVREALFDEDGSTVVVSAQVMGGFGAGGPSNDKTNVALFDAATGSQLGDTYMATGTERIPVQFSRDGKYAVLVSSQLGGIQVTVLDSDTGLRIGAPVDISGYDTGTDAMLFTVDGKRAYVTVNGSAAKIVGIDLENGTKLGEASLGTGYAIAGLTQEPNRADKALQTVVYTNPDSSRYTRVVVVDIAGEPEVGKGVNLTGMPANAGVIIGGDTMHALQTTYTGTGFASYTTTFNAVDISVLLNEDPQTNVSMRGAPDISTGVIYYAFNPSDPENNPVTVTFTQPAHGVLTDLGSDLYSYTPDLGYFATQPAGSVDSLAVTVYDNRGGVSTKTVTVPVVMPDLTSGVVNLPVGNAWALAAAPDNTGVYFVQVRHDETTLQDRYSLSFIDSATKTNTDVATLPGYFGQTFVGDDGRVYLAGDTSVAVFDPADGHLTTVPLTGTVLNLTPSADATKVYATTANSDYTHSQFATVDLVGGTTTYIDIPDRQDYYLSSLRPVISDDGTRAYLLQQNGVLQTHSVVVVDTITGDVDFLDGEGQPNGIALTPDGAHLYVTSNRAGDDNGGILTVIDTTTLAPPTAIDLGWGVDQLAIDPVTGEIYISAFQYYPDQGIDRDAILVLGPNSSTPTSIEVPGFMYDLAFTPDGETLYGATYVNLNENGDYITQITAIDTQTRAISFTRIADAPSKFVLGSDGDQISGYALIYMFNPATHSYDRTVISLIPLNDSSLSV